MLSRKEENMIRRYCLYPQIAMAALVMAFVILGPWLILEMVDDLVFHNEKFVPYGLYVCLGFVGFFLFTFCYCILKSKFGMRGKKWRELGNRLNIRQSEKDYSGKVAGAIGLGAAGSLMEQSENKTLKKAGKAMEVAGAVDTVAVALEMSFEQMENANEMANTYGVKVPKIKKYLISFAVASVLILIAVYIPQFKDANLLKKENIALASERIEEVKEALSPVCEYVSADSPKERYQAYGYKVFGYIRGLTSDGETSYVVVEFNKLGVITRVSYDEEISMEKSMEENLNQIEEDFKMLHGALENLNVPLLSVELLSIYQLPDDFRKAFLSGSYYEGIKVRYEENNSNIYCCYETDSEEQFNAYSRPRVYLNIYGK